MQSGFIGDLEGNNASGWKDKIADLPLDFQNGQWIILRGNSIVNQDRFEKKK